MLLPSVPFSKDDRDEPAELRSMGGSSDEVATFTAGGGVEPLTLKSSIPTELGGRDGGPCWWAGGGGAEGDGDWAGRSSRWAHKGVEGVDVAGVKRLIAVVVDEVVVMPGKLVMAVVVGGGGGAKNCWSCFSCCCCKLWDRSARNLALSASISNLRLLLLRLVPLSRSSFATEGMGLQLPPGTIPADSSVAIEGVTADATIDAATAATLDAATVADGK